MARYMVSDMSRDLPSSLTLMMNSIANALMKKKWGSVKIVPIISDVSFNELVGQMSIELEMEIECKEIVKEGECILWRCEVARRVQLARNSVVLTGAFFALQRGNFVHLITGERNLFLKRIILPLTRKLFPVLLRAYISSSEMFELLDSFSKAKQIALRYDQVVYKRMFGEAFTDTRHEKRLDKSKHESFTEAFKEARKQGGWVDRIHVFGGGYAFSLARSGFLRCQYGDFNEYYRHFLSKIEEFSTGRLKIFEKRGRREQPQNEVRPILIQFDSDVFEDVTVRKQFVQMVNNYPNCTYSVIHGGNPHVYITVLDRVDNSSFSVRTLGAKALLLLPQIRTTKAALMRFSRHLSDRFREGVISSFET